ncbi:MAG: PhzF family phenazine biosynthesis protein [Haloferacaceae archaeon]
MPPATPDDAFDLDPSGPRYHIVDVFAERRYAGNPLAVVEDRGRLSDESMGQIAAEFDFSETTFVESFAPDEAPVRIFTPEAEVPFAGHPTLGTAAVVRAVTGATGETTTLDLDVGAIPVEARADGTLWMTQRDPTFGPERDRAAAAAALSLDPGEVADRPVREVSTGLPTVVVPLADRAALERVAVDRAAYDALVADTDAKNVLAFCTDPRDDDNDLAARVFAPFYGVPEDPATGSSNGCLAAYLARERLLDGPALAARVEQGHGMGRPSVLGVEADDRGDGTTVRVGGRVVHVGSGRLRAE